VVFLSVVDTPTGGTLPFRDQQMFKQRFNVAASRARDQMWVVHSLDPSQTCNLATCGAGSLSTPRHPNS